ncbi:MAG: hypothetical protein WA102_09660 [Candidatus Methanoperedens sp.]
MLPLSDRVSHHTKATIGSLLLRAVAADIQVLRTVSHDTALPFFFTQEQTCAVGF